MLAAAPSAPSPLHPFDARNCSAGVTAAPVLITAGDVEDLPEAETLHRGRRSRRVGDRTTARQVRVARRAKPRPGDGTKRGGARCEGAKLVRRRAEGHGRE